MVAEGIIDGKVVCTTKRMPSRRSTKLRLKLDTEGKQLVADGSDFIVVVAEVTDDSGNVRRLAKENIVFSIEGEGEIVGDASIHANPRPVEFGTAPLLVRSTGRAGKVKVTAHVQFEGTHAPTSAEIEFESIPCQLPFCHIEQQQDTVLKRVVSDREQDSVNSRRFSEEEKKQMLDEVEKQQTEFGIEK